MRTIEQENEAYRRQAHADQMKVLTEIGESQKRLTHMMEKLVDAIERRNRLT